MNNRKRKKISKEDALSKMERYCAYQDRCHYEVKNKLWELGFWGDWAGEIIVQLIEDDFLNEERFACSFARGKFRMKRWGRVKISKKLREKRITPRLIKFAIEKEIEEEVYLETLNMLIDKKRRLLKVEDVFIQNGKIANYCIQKGYEVGLVWQVLKIKV